MAYGFRMYYFGLHEKFGRDKLDLTMKFGQKTAAELLERLLTQLAADKSTRWAMPSLKNAADGTDITGSSELRVGESRRAVV